MPTPTVGRYVPIEALRPSKPSDCDTFDYGAHSQLPPDHRTLFLKTASTEPMTVAADACVKALEDIGKEDKELKETRWRSYMYSTERKAIEAISSLCERIIKQADAPNAACGQRNRD
eukprot:930604-Prymnesium_polylepis.1